MDELTRPNQDMTLIRKVFTTGRKDTKGPLADSWNPGLCHSWNTRLPLHSHPSQNLSLTLLHAHLRHEEIPHHCLFYRSSSARTGYHCLLRDYLPMYTNSTWVVSWCPGNMYRPNYLLPRRVSRQYCNRINDHGPANSFHLETTCAEITKDRSYLCFSFIWIVSSQPTKRRPWI